MKMNVAQFHPSAEKEKDKTTPLWFCPKGDRSRTWEYQIWFGGVTALSFGLRDPQPFRCVTPSAPALGGLLQSTIHL